MYQTGCRHFSGYRPCGKNSECSPRCPHLDVPQTYILMIHLGPLHSVIRATAILPLIKKKYPRSHITWVTDFPLVLENNPQIDRILSSHEDDLIFLNPLEFDVGLVVDKNILATSVLERAKRVDFVYGFKSNESGAIVPATSAAFEYWEWGLNLISQYKNKKNILELQIGALCLGGDINDELVTPKIFLSQQEQQVAQLRKMLWSQRGQKKVIGLYTSRIEMVSWQTLILGLIQCGEFSEFSFVLIGDQDQELTHQYLNHEFDFLNLSPINEGLRSLFCSVEACDIVIGKDRLGLMLAIAAQRYLIAMSDIKTLRELGFYKNGTFLKPEIQNLEQLDPQLFLNLCKEQNQHVKLSGDPDSQSNYQVKLHPSILLGLELEKNSVLESDIIASRVHNQIQDQDQDQSKDWYDAINDFIL